MSETRLAICVPGKRFPTVVIKSIINLITHLHARKIEYRIYNEFSPNIYDTRNLIVESDCNYNNPNIFDGFDYTHSLWIDDDISFTPDQVFNLLKHDVDIVSGLYIMSNNTQYAAVQFWDESFFAKNGYFQFLNREDIKNSKGLMRVEYIGMGFCLIKHGIFESIKGPWFNTRFFKIGKTYDFCMEDVGFSKNALDEGYKIFIDTNTIVTHNKMMQLK
jgi:hypothetical protein